jgi:hypothetical protein
LVVAPPQTTFSLDAAADHFRFSAPIVQLGPSQFLDMAFTPIQINQVPVEAFGHTISFWLSATTEPPQTVEDSLSFDLGWTSGPEWTFGYRPFLTGFRWTDTRRTLVMGVEKRVRLARRSDGAVEFWLDGENLLTLDDASGARTLYAQVVGTRATFAYGPGTLNNSPARAPVASGRGFESSDRYLCEDSRPLCVPRP